MDDDLPLPVQRYRRPRVRVLSHYGFWSMAHEVRTDWSIWLGSLFLILVGGGPYSLDAVLARRRRGTARPR